MIKTVIPKSVEEVYAWIDNVRQNSDSYVTNFYAGQGSINKWIEWKQLEYFNTEHVFLLLRSSKFSKQLYYFADSIENVGNALLLLTTIEDQLNLDFLGEEDSVHNMLENIGFHHYITLHRMTKLDKTGCDEPLSYGEYAAFEDAHKIQELLEQTMDLNSDQVPCTSEIEDYIKRNAAIVTKKGLDIIACVMWTRQGKRMEWNYWALNPKYKGTTYSLDLLEAYLRLNGSVVRTTLFVRDRNPASAIYGRIGFKYDGLKDFVYCYRRGQ